MSQPPMQIRFASPNRPGTPQQRPGVIQLVSRQNSPLLSQRFPLIVKSSNTNTAVQYMKSDEYNQDQGHHQQQFQQIPTPSFMNQFTATGIPGLSSFSLANSAAALMAQGGNNSASSGSRKPCNCTKSNCLKLYCECFAQGQLCQNCNCNNCMNNLAHEEERRRAVKMTLERNPAAFNPKIGRGEGERRHTKGCNCKRSGCLKNYCECYEAKISCSDMCRCHSCKNTEDSIERRSLLRLAALGSYKSKHSSSYKKHLQEPSPETLPHSFFTWEIIEALVSCLLAQADDAERRDLPAAVQERLILEEFGRSVDLVIKSAGKAQVRAINTTGIHGDDARFGGLRRNIDEIDDDLDGEISGIGTGDGASNARKSSRRPEFRRSDDDLDEELDEDLEDDLPSERDIMKRVTSMSGRQVKQQPLEEEDIDEENYKHAQKSTSKSTTKKSTGGRKSRQAQQQQHSQVEDSATPTRTSGRKHIPSRRFRNEEYD